MATCEPGEQRGESGCEAPDLMTAFREAAWLKLVPKRGVLDTIRIDEIETPTRN